MGYKVISGVGSVCRGVDSHHNPVPYNPKQDDYISGRLVEGLIHITTLYPITQNNTARFFSQLALSTSHELYCNSQRCRQRRPSAAEWTEPRAKRMHWPTRSSSI